MPSVDDISGMSPGPALYHMAMGYYVPRALALVAELGFADLLTDGPRNARDLAAATQTHAPSLARVLRLLASVGVFAELPDGSFALTPLSEALRKDAPLGPRLGAYVLRRGSTGRLAGP